MDFFFFFFDHYLNGNALDGLMVAIFHLVGIVPVLHVMLIRSRMISFPLVPMAFAPGAFSFLLRSLIRSLSESMSFSALWTDEKCLLKLSAFFWSSVIVPSSVLNGFGFVLRFSPLRLFNSAQAFAPSFRKSKLEQVLYHFSYFAAFTVFLTLAVVRL